MLLCDRCNKKATTSVNITPKRGVDLCPICEADYRDVVEQFLSGIPISKKAPDIAAPPVDAVLVITEPVADTVEGSVEPRS